MSFAYQVYLPKIIAIGQNGQQGKNFRLEKICQHANYMPVFH